LWFEAGAGRGGRYWQVPGVATEPEQAKPVAQSASEVQVVLHPAGVAVLSQAKGMQLAVEALHWPATQVEVATPTPPSGQLDGAQVLPAA
jgi:hypothetical protein